MQKAAARELRRGRRGRDRDFVGRQEQLSRLGNVPKSAVAPEGSKRLCDFAAAGLELGVNYAKYFLSQLKRGKIEPNGTSSASTHSVPVRREFVMYNKGEESCGSHE